MKKPNNQRTTNAQLTNSRRTGRTAGEQQANTYNNSNKYNKEKKNIIKKHAHEELFEDVSTEKKSWKQIKAEREKTPPSSAPPPSSIRDNEYPDLEEMFKDLIADEYWHETVCMQWRISPEAFKTYFDKFMKIRITSSERYQNINKAKSHFGNWLSKIKDSEKEKKNEKPTRKDRLRKIRITKP